jgi:coenzyme F420-reducing hydrogenase beta subunit
MASDKEGFLKPSVNEIDCIKCGRCLKVCPSLNFVERNRILEGYIALKLGNKKSASGGVFFELASKIIDNGGYVAGCILNSELEVQHIISNSMYDVEKMCSSKYVQSSVCGIYEQIKIILSQNKQVLFCGTPCQCAALLKYIGHPDNLVLVDIICHGVPSPVFWGKAVEKICEQYQVKPDSFTFRDKNRSERTVYQYTIKTQNKKLVIDYRNNPYYNQFMRGNSFRECCYTCQYANSARVGDITLGDCATWMDYMDFYPYTATSTVLVNTELGRKIWNIYKDQFSYKPLNVDKEIISNAQLNHPSKITIVRDKIYLDLENLTWNEFERKYVEKFSVSYEMKKMMKQIFSVRFREKIRGIIKNGTRKLKT